MGLIASYRMIDDAELAELIPDPDGELPTGALWSADDTTDRVVDIGENWDVLHLVLTGVSASEPVEDNLLSEAVVGVENLDEDEDADFVAITHTLELAEIVTALREVNVARAVAAVLITDQVRAEIHPEGVLDNGVVALVPTLTQAVRTLLAFYDRAAGAGRHVVVSII